MSEGRCPDACGECCAYMTFAAPSTDADYIEWLGFHGCRLTYRAGGWHVRVPIPCRFLMASGKCGCYKERPPMCHEYDCEKHLDYAEYEEQWLRAKRECCGS